MALEIFISVLVTIWFIIVFIILFLFCCMLINSYFENKTKIKNLIKEKKNYIDYLILDMERLFDKIITASKSFYVGLDKEDISLVYLYGSVLRPIKYKYGLFDWDLETLNDLDVLVIVKKELPKNFSSKKEIALEKVYTGYGGYTLISDIAWLEKDEESSPKYLPVHINYRTAEQFKESNKNDSVVQNTLKEGILIYPLKR